MTQTKTNTGNSKSNNNTAAADSSAEDDSDEEEEQKEAHDEVSQLHTQIIREMNMSIFLLANRLYF